MGKEQNTVFATPTPFYQTGLLRRGRDTQGKQIILSNEALGNSWSHTGWKENEAYSVSKWIVEEAK